MTDHIVKAIGAALRKREATQYRLRQAGIGSATAARLLDGKGPIESDSLSKALDAYGLTVRVEDVG